MSWNTKFTDNVTNIAFKLSLTRNQVRGMFLARHYDLGLIQGTRDQFADFTRSIPALRQLSEMGLIEHKDWDKLTWAEREGPKETHQWYRLTPAGLLVWDMLKLAGLVTEPVKVEKAA